MTTTRDGGPAGRTGVLYVRAAPGDGYGNAATGYLAALEHLGVATTVACRPWREVGPIRGMSDAGLDPWVDEVGADAAADTLVVHQPPPQLAAYVAAFRRSRSFARVVGITTAETDPISPTWVSAVQDLDALIVPSTFNAASFAASGVTTPIHVVPHVWRPHGSSPAAERFDHPDLGDRFVFYAIGPWITRKALPETVLAFLDAFDADDDVALVIKTGSLDEQARVRGRFGPPALTWFRLATLLAGRPAPPPIVLVTTTWDDASVAGLHDRGDCHLAINRGEGFGLTVLDAAGAGNPVVATGWGGPLDILGTEHPLLVRHRLIRLDEDIPDGWIVPSGRRWARADHDHAVELMRWVAGHRDEARRIGSAGAARVGTRFRLEAVAPTLAAVLAG